jgi:hypothetical protein
MTRLVRCSLLATLAGLPLAGIAVSAGLGTHEHGVADLSLALDGRDFEIVLVAPAGDLVGLESAPRDAAERRGIVQRVAEIEAGQWFSFVGATCERIDVGVELPDLLRTMAAAAPHAEPDSAHDHTDDPAHSHDHGHDHAHDHTHDHDAHDGYHGAAAHLDGIVSWRYRCNATPSAVSVELFDAMPFTLIRVQTLTDRGPRTARLTPEARRALLE